VNNSVIHPDDKLIVAPKTKVHGDELIFLYLNYVLYFLKDKKNISVIEIGSERGTGSTYKLAKLCKKMNWHFITVDADDKTASLAREIVHKVNLSFEAHHELGEVFLNNYSGKNIGICYLDAFDIVTDWPHKPDAVAAYKKRNVEITNQAAYKMHYDAAYNVHQKIVSGGFISFDDVWLDKTNTWQGKGKTAIPFLLDHGFIILKYINNSLLLQNTNGLDKTLLEEGKKILNSINLTKELFLRKLRYGPKKLLKRIFS
jgi:hypothetical protein